MEIINAKELARIDFNYEKIIDTIMKEILNRNILGFKSFEIYLDNEKLFGEYDYDFVFNNFKKLGNYIHKIFNKIGYTVEYIENPLRLGRYLDEDQPGSIIIRW